MQKKTIIIVGSLFGGIKCPWELRRRLKDGWKIQLISDKPQTIFRASFPHVIFGDTKVRDLTMDLAKNFAGTGIEFICDPLIRVLQDENAIQCQNITYRYDFLVLATGVRHAYELLPGSKE